MIVELGQLDFRTGSSATTLPVAQTEPAEFGTSGLAGKSEAFLSLCSFVRRLAPTNVTVLVSGETGTGKELIAAMVHRLSKRARGPLVALNCAAIPDALIEGELFGYERGAFSGAIAGHPGKLKLADGGTLLLDEVGELSLAAQAKLLRAIETGEAYRLGARSPTRFDIRIIASTNRNLMREVAGGGFRADLYYRLAVAQLELPPLRVRTEDIAPIARHILMKLAIAADRPGMRLNDAAIRALEHHAWPGNARELRNVLEVALINTDGDCISARDLPFANAACTPPVPTEVLAQGDEKAMLTDMLDKVQGNKSLAARALNCSRMTLYRRMTKFGLT
jgi:transcriptional regulator with PAS, ATPase and Fis domain